MDDREEGLDAVIREEMDEASEEERLIYSLPAADHLVFPSSPICSLPPSVFINLLVLAQ